MVIHDPMILLAYNECADQTVRMHRPEDTRHGPDCLITPWRTKYLRGYIIFIIPSVLLSYLFFLSVLN